MVRGGCGMASALYRACAKGETFSADVAKTVPEEKMLGCLFGEDGEDLAGSHGDQGAGNSRGSLKAPPAPRNKTRLSGLSNLGATCYLNSLLQTLHFTTEFRGEHRTAQ